MCRKPLCIVLCAAGQTWVTLIKRKNSAMLNGVGWSRTYSAYVQARTRLKQSTLLLTCVKNSKLSLLSLHTRTHTDRISPVRHLLQLHTRDLQVLQNFIHTFSICRLLSSPTLLLLLQLLLLQLLPCHVALRVLSALLPLQPSPAGSHWGLQLRFAYHSSTST